MKSTQSGAKISQFVVLANILNHMGKKYVKAGGRADVIRVSKLLENIPGEKTKAAVQAICEGYDYVFVINAGASEYEKVQTQILDYFKGVFGVTPEVKTLQLDDNKYQVFCPVSFNLSFQNPKK